MFTSHYRYSILFLLLFCGLNYSFTQRGDYRIMFYNLENLFDTIDNPNTRDDEFLPDGDKHWDNYRYWKKINRTYQVLAAGGEQLPPEIVGVCEVESFLPLYHLANNTPLSKFPYSIIHKDSPDRRGIDVALLYQSKKVELLEKEFIRVQFPSDTAKKTRDILLAKFKVRKDTLHIFVNHWPSRMGGQARSEPYRLHVAKHIKAKVDLIYTLNSNSKVIVMGDLNDEPHNKSLGILTKEGMVNLSEDMKETCKCGTYKYKSQWNMLDQVIVSPSLMNEENLHVIPGSLKILRSDFLLEPDNTNGGQKPYRTYRGPQYIGGYSDHLPVILDLFWSN